MIILAHPAPPVNVHISNPASGWLGIPAGIWAAAIALTGALIVLAVNARQARREAGWKRVETGLELIAADDDDKLRIGLTIIQRVIASKTRILRNNRFLSSSDLHLIDPLTTDVANRLIDMDERAQAAARAAKEAAADKDSGIPDPSATVDSNEGSTRHDEGHAPEGSTS